MIFKTEFTSPIGVIRVYFNVKYLISLELVFQQSLDNAKGEEKITPFLEYEIKKQFNDYFEGRLKKFSLPYYLSSTSNFELTCWHLLGSIPYGQTISYSQQASYLGNINKRRAVARANSKNPLPILIPCHRVICACGKIGGYNTNSGQKPELKKFLLDLERKYI